MNKEEILDKLQKERPTIKNQTLHPTTDETICIDGIEVDDRKFDLAASHFYGKFIENKQQTKDK